MATTKAKGKARKYYEVPSELNIWTPKAVGNKLECMVIAVNHKGKFGLQVKVVDAAGTIYTLPSHKILQDRLEFALGKIKGKRAVLDIEYTGEVKGDKAQPAQNYTVRYAFLEEGELFGQEDTAEAPAY